VNPSVAPRILVADDDRDNVRALLAILELEGFDARGMHTGFDVLQEVQTSGADAILLDIGMPQFDGYAVAKELRRRYAGAKPLLIAVTGRSTGLDEALAKAAGFDYYVTKPYRPQQLIKLLEPLRKPSTHGGQDTREAKVPARR
jgi:CheY-like chemotaxis protein